MFSWITQQIFRPTTVLAKVLRLGIAATGVAAFAAGCAFDPLSAAPQSDGKPDGTPLPRTSAKPPAGKEFATLGGGCFWCTEAMFKELKGVEAVMPGYAGGHVANPSYEDVCTGTTGHAEAIQITFDPKEISYHDLLTIFMTVHDPTTLNQQGNDVGTQYRSAIFYDSPEQEKVAKQVISEIKAKHIWSNPIVTEITPFTNFYAAEDYHRDYFARNGNQPYCAFIIAPKVQHLREEYRAKLKKP